jgi:hypothetical protein
MKTRSLDHLSVWLDTLSSNDGAFPQAMDWAYRLSLPLRVVVTSERVANHALGQVEHGITPSHEVKRAALLLE